MQYYKYCFFISFLVLTMLLLLHINSILINKLNHNTVKDDSAFRKIIYDIDSNKKKIEFDNNKYIYNLYKKHDSFMVLNANKQNINPIDNDKNELKYNMMKPFNKFE